MGIYVWQPYEEDYKLQRRYFGGFTVRSFEVPHDNEPCCGFLIECPNGERLLYATDFEYIPYTFAKWRIHHLLIEANYQEKYVDKYAENRNHVLRGHSELGTTLDVIDDNKKSVKTVILCHLSDSNSDAEEMITEVKRILQNETYVDYARKGLVISL